MNQYAPITLFVYNRLSHTKKTIETLQKNTLSKDSDLFIFSDGPKIDSELEKIKELRNYLKNVTGFKSVTIFEKEKNIGLANSIISGVTEIVNKFGKIIVLEDDLVTSPFFLSYMNQGLDLYQDENEVVSIHGYVYPLVKKNLPETFFIKGADCWGWATWKRGWNLFEKDGQKLYDKIVENNLEKEFNFDDTFKYTKMLRGQISGRNNSWAIRWYASAFLKNKLTLYPRESLVNNIGFDGTGTHFNKPTDQTFEVKISDKNIILKPIEIMESKIGRKAFVKYFRSIGPSFLVKTKNKLKDIVKKILKP